MYKHIVRTEGAGDNTAPTSGSGRDHPNAVMLRNAHGAFQNGDMEAMFALFAPDMIWHMPGNNLLAGDFIGRDGILSNFAMLAENTDSYWAQALDYFGSDDHAVLVARVQSTRKGRTLDCQEILLFKAAGGKFHECWHLALDEKAWDAFFS